MRTGRISEQRAGSTIHDHEGFSLVEIVIAMLISTILGLLAFEVFLFTDKAEQYELERSEMEEELLMTMNIIDKDIKNTGADPNGSGNFCNFNFYYPGQSNIGGPYYYKNIISTQFDLSDPPNGDVNDPGEQVLYYNDASNNLYRMVSKKKDVWPKDADGTPIGDLLASSMRMSISYTTGELGSQSCKDFTNAVCLNRIDTVTLTLNKTGVKNDPNTGNPLALSLSRTILIRNYGIR